MTDEQWFDIFLAHNSKDKPMVRTIVQKLRDEGLNPWIDEQQIRYGDDIPEKVREGIKRSRIAAFIIGTAGFGRFQQTLELSALTMICSRSEVKFIPILLPGVNQLPDELDLFQGKKYLQFEKTVNEIEKLQELIDVIKKEREQGGLTSPAPPQPYLKKPLCWNVPNLPPNFLPRPEDLEKLKTSLLKNQSVVMTGSSASVSVQGMGGIGKTTLATAVARDESVQQAFPDGVFWLTVGQEPKLLELQTRLAKALGQQPEFSTVEQGKIDLKTYLQGKKCLLVLDDVWRVEDLEELNVVEADSQLLVTTRSAEISTSLGAEDYQIDVLSKAQARHLLAEWTELAEPSLPQEADEVIQQCGYLPLALAMVGAMLRSTPGRWSNVLHKLKSAQLDKIQHKISGIRTGGQVMSPVV